MIADPVRRSGRGELCTVIGGTGFLGRRIVQSLVEDGWRVRIASRRPSRAGGWRKGDVDAVRSDVTVPSSLRPALKGASAVVNATSLYVETAETSFEDVHVSGAFNVARQATEAGVERLAHVSGIGADTEEPDAYISARGRGEEAVRQTFPGAILTRPSIMFGHGEALIGAILRQLNTLPLFPLFGSGETRLQPVHVEDVARAIATAVEREPAGDSYDLGGPRVYTYRDLVRSIARSAGLRARFLPVPFPLWELAAAGAEWMSHPPLTRHQVALMRQDNVANDAGMERLAVIPRPLEPEVQDIVLGR